VTALNFKGHYGEATPHPPGLDAVAARLVGVPSFISPKQRFIEQSQADLGRPVPSQKIFRFAADPNHTYIHCRLVPHEGRIAIVTDAGRDAVDAAALGVQGSAGRIALRERRAGMQDDGAVSPSSELGATSRADDLAEMGVRVRRSRVVLTPRRWRQVLRRLVRLNRVGQNL
jgi:hypothetical protein